MKQSKNIEYKITAILSLAVIAWSLYEGPFYYLFRQSGIMGRSGGGLQITADWLALPASIVLVISIYKIFKR